MKVLLLALLALATAARGQDRSYTLYDTPQRIDSLTGALTYSEVVRVDSATSAQLFERANLFLTKAFVNAATTTHVADASTGVLSGRGRIQLTMGLGTQLALGRNDYYYELALEVRVKDGRYRYEVGNIESVSGQWGRGNMDDAYRRYPKAIGKVMNRKMSEKQYRAFMEKDPVMLFVGRLKAAMNPRTDKNDF